MSRVLYVGMRAPQAVRVICDSGESGLDMTTVSSVVLRTTLAGAVRDWNTVMSGATTTQITATHTLAADGSDLPARGNLRVTAIFTTPAGERQATPFRIPVEET